MWTALVLICQLVIAVQSQPAYGVDTSLVRRDISQTLYSNLDFFAQYAGAGYCEDSDSVVDTLITCADDVCPQVETDKAYTIAEFTGNSTDQAGFVAIDPTNSLIVVSFRGSDSIQNFFYDVLFAYTACEFGDGCQAEYGFYASWLSVKDVVVSAVKSAVSSFPNHKLITTGHSLGGAVAIIAGAYLRDAGYSVDIYTYGSPRVFNDVGANYVSAQAGGNYRVTHLDDPVPRLPPIILGYRHTSPEYWISGGSATTDSVPISSIEVCPGIANVSCNAGEILVDILAHTHYFEYIGACADFGLNLKKRDNATTDNATATANDQQKTMFAQLDIAYAQALQGVA